MSVLRISSEFNQQADLTLYDGSCVDLLMQIPNEIVQLVVTSPPYNIGKPYETKVNLDDYIVQQRQIIAECVRVLSPTGSICWQVGNYVNDGEIVPLDLVLYPIFASFNLQLRNRIVWHFGHGLHASRRFSGRYEVVLWFTKSSSYVFDLDAVRVPQKYPGKRYFKGPKKGQLSGNPVGKNPGDIWEIPNVKANHVEKTAHPCQFPVELVERLVLSMTRPNDWVLDPFLGTGTTAIAALMHSRRAVGSEISPEYMAIARDRIRAAESGTLRIRPMNRPVYEPGMSGEQVPPQTVSLGVSSERQLALLETSESYGGEESLK